MHLNDLDPSLPDTIAITGISADSRSMEKGYVFAALPGSRANGADYISTAIMNGAVAVIAHPDSVVNGAYHIKTENPSLTFAHMAAKFYGRQPAHCVAVTGTNGKTSVASFTRQLWTLLNIKAASLGTLGVQTNKTNRPIGLTTPDAGALHAMLADLSATGVDHLVMEASSHGLHQYRLHGVALQAAAFTNITRDHLDYHGSMDNYLDAKLKLFSELLQPGKTAILNADIPEYEKIAAACTKRGLAIMTYGEKGKDIQLTKLDVLPHAQKMHLRVMGTDYTVNLPLLGQFQVWNAMAALGLVIAGGIAPENAVPLLEKLTSVKGRIEFVAATPAGAPVFIDYAHTPNALEIVLTALRHHATNKLWVVFGCGGNRDKGKRAIMGQIANDMADCVVVTDDNPRDENPAEIRASIIQTCPHAHEIADRAEAIQFAIRNLAAGDVLVIAGKGHEQGQIVKSEVIPFDDFITAEQALAQLS